MAYYASGTAEAETSSARVLMSKLDELRALRQKLASESTLDDRLTHQSRRDRAASGAEVEEWRTRAMVAETRVGDLENVLSEERRARYKLAEQLRKLETGFKQERDTLEHDITELLARNSELQHLLKREKVKSKKTADSLIERIKEMGEYLDHTEIDMEHTVSSARGMESELTRIRKERDEAFAEGKALRARLEEVEGKVMPKAAEDQRKLEAEIVRLREELDDAVESETALRALFLQEQNARLRRRSRGAGEIFS